jgi:hypothetical protein
MKSFRELIAEYLDDHPEEMKGIEDADIDRWLAENTDEMLDKFSSQLAEDG